MFANSAEAFKDFKAIAQHLSFKLHVTAGISIKNPRKAKQRLLQTAGHSEGHSGSGTPFAPAPGKATKGTFCLWR